MVSVYYSCFSIYIYISSVYSPFSDRVGLPLHNIPSSGVLMKSIGAEFFTTGCSSWPQLIQLYKFVCTMPIQNININLHSKPPFIRLLRLTLVKAEMQF